MTAALHSTSALLAFALGAGACFLPDLELTGKDCPCAAGYSCDAATNTCVLGSGGSTSVAPPTTDSSTGVGANNNGGAPSSGGSPSNGGAGPEGGFGGFGAGPVGGDGTGGSPPPTDGTCEIPFTLVEGVTVADSTVGTGDDMQGCISPDGPDLVYEMVPMQTGTYELTLYSQAEMLIYARSDCFDPSSEIACVDENGTNSIEVTYMTVTAGVPVYVIVDGHGGEESDFTLDVVFFP